MSRTAIPTYTTSQVIDASHANTYWADNEAAHWSAISALAGSFELIEKITLPSAAQFRFLDIPQTYRHLRLYWHTRHNSPYPGRVTMYLRFNEFGGTGGGTYDTTFIHARETGEVLHQADWTHLLFGFTPSVAYSSSYWANGFMTIYDYATTVKKNRVMTMFNACKYGTTSYEIDIEKGVSIWSGASEIVTMTMRTYDDIYSGVDFVAGSTMWLYGLL